MDFIVINALKELNHHSEQCHFHNVKIMVSLQETEDCCIFREK